MALPTRRSIRRALVALPVALAALATACAPMPQVRPEANQFDDHEWTQVADDAPWGRRAGVESVVLGDSMFLVGGRTPNPFVPFPQGPIPGDSTIWGDTWRSDDLGATTESDRHVDQP